MKSNTEKNKQGLELKVCAKFTKAERENWIRYLKWQLENSKKPNVKDVVLVGVLGYDTSLPIYARVTTAKIKVGGKEKTVEMIQRIESVLEEMVSFLKPNYSNDRLYRISINMVDYVSLRWGFIKICSRKTTSKRKRTPTMEKVRDYFLWSAGSYLALKWGIDGYLVLGKENPKNRALEYIKRKGLLGEYKESENTNPVEFLMMNLNAQRGYYERPGGLYVLMIVNGEFVLSKDKDYDKAALEYLEAHEKLKKPYQKQKKLSPAQFLMVRCKAIKINYFISPRAEEDNLKKFDIVDRQHIPTAEVSIKEFTDKDIATLSWLLFFSVKGYQLSNQVQCEQFDSWFGKDRKKHL